MKLTQEFDKQYQDLWDYIVKITHYIWEERNVDSIRQLYKENIKMHLPNGYAEGNELVVQSTFEMLNAFPDRRLLPEDIIGSHEENNALYSSHRIINTMSKTGDGIFGEIKGKNAKKRNFGKKIFVRGIADCLVKNNQVIEEWLIRDVRGLLESLGIDYKKHAQQVALEKFSHLQKDKKDPWHWSKCQQTEPKLNDKQTNNATLQDAKEYAYLLKNIWEQGKLALIREKYHLAVRVETPARTLYGQELLQQFYFSYLGALSDISFRIEHLAQDNPPESPKKFAIRWSVVAKHSGNGVFGVPSNNLLYIMGISHAYLSQGQIVSEWILIDEVAIWEQVFLNFLQKKNQ